MTILSVISTAAVVLCGSLTVTATAPTLSVLYFENLSPDSAHAHLGKALAEMLINDLAATGGITVVEREQIEKIMKEMALGLTGVVDETTSPKVGKLLGAHYLITGNYLIERKTILVNFKIIEVETGTILGSDNIEGTTRELLKIKSSMARSTIGKIQTAIPGIKTPPAKTETVEVPLEHITDYGRALDLGDRGDLAGAQDVLKGLETRAPQLSYVKKEIEGLRKRIEEYDRTREKALSAQRAQPLTWQSFTRTTIGYASSMRYSQLLSYCMDIRDNPPEAPEGSMVDGPQMVDYYITLALHSLKKWDRLIEEGEAFLNNYPASMYYTSVKLYVNQAVIELSGYRKKIDTARAAIAPLEAKLKSARGDERALLEFQIASHYLGEQLHEQALDHFRRLDLKGLERKGIPPDMILFSIFVCHYNLQNKNEAAKILRTIEAFYPESENISSMQTMFAVFPE